MIKLFGSRFVKKANMFCVAVQNGKKMEQKFFVTEKEAQEFRKNLEEKK